MKTAWLLVQTLVHIWEGNYWMLLEVKRASREQQEKKGQIKFFHLELLFSFPRSWDEEKIKFISKDLFRFTEGGVKKERESGCEI